VEPEVTKGDSLTADNVNNLLLKAERTEEDDPTNKPAVMSMKSFRKGSRDSVVKGIQKSYGDSSTSSLLKGDKTAPANSIPRKSTTGQDLSKSRGSGEVLQDRRSRVRRLVYAMEGFDICLGQNVTIGLKHCVLTLACTGSAHAQPRSVWLSPAQSGSVGLRLLPLRSRYPPCNSHPKAEGHHIWSVSLY
jgi:hypothetical protein